MTKTEKIADSAKIIVDGIAFSVSGDKIYVVNLHSLKYRACFSKKGKLLYSNMSEKTLKRVNETLNDNMEFLD